MPKGPLGYKLKCYPTSLDIGKLTEEGRLLFLTGKINRSIACVEEGSQVYYLLIAEALATGKTWGKTGETG